MITMKRSCSCSMPGVLHAVLHNPGASVIFHSPKACGHVANTMDLGGHYRKIARREFIPGTYQAPLYISGLQEEHSIFGGTEVLRECIDDVLSHSRPEYILIANSCVSGVIGDDTQAVAEEAEKKWGIPIMAVPCGGFLDGEYYAGFYYTAKVLIERFMAPQIRITGTVTLLGDRGTPDGLDIREMKKLLEAMGLNVHCYFPVYSAIEDIRRVTASEFCVLLAGRSESYTWIKKLAGELHEKFGVGYFDQDYPLGWQDTKKWLKQLGEFLQKSDLAKQVTATQAKRLAAAKQKLAGTLSKRKITFCIGRPLKHFDPSWVFDLIDQSGAILESLVFLPSLTPEQQQEMTETIRRYTDIPVVAAAAGDAAMNQADLIVTTHELASQKFKQFFLPVVPPAGVGGLVDMLEKLSRLTRRTRKQGGVIYG